MLVQVKEHHNCGVPTEISAIEEKNAFFLEKMQKVVFHIARNRYLWHVVVVGLLWWILTKFKLVD